MKDMKEKFGKKKGLSDVEKEAKMGVVKDLRDMAHSAMSDRLKGLKKVTVASDSQPGLEHGLDKAKELLHGQSGDMLDASESEEGESPMHEAAESAEMEASEHAEGGEEAAMSKEELQAKIEELQKLLEEKA